MIKPRSVRAEEERAAGQGRGWREHWRGGQRGEPGLRKGVSVHAWAGERSDAIRVEVARGELAAYREVRIEPVIRRYRNAGNAIRRRGAGGGLATDWQVWIGSIVGHNRHSRYPIRRGDAGRGLAAYG